MSGLVDYGSSDEEEVGLVGDLVLGVRLFLFARERVLLDFTLITAADEIDLDCGA